MHRFYIPIEIGADEVVLSDARLLHHVRDVVRLGTGDEIVIFDSQGNECLCTIQELDRTQAKLAIKSRRKTVPRVTGITVACAVPKRGFDEVVDSLTQLGVDAIIPVQTARGVVKLDEARQQSRLQRWTRIAHNAAEQSRRGSVPTIGPVMGFNDVLIRSEAFGVKLFPTLSGNRKELKEVLRGSHPHNVFALIGPEGDFTPQELGLALDAGFIPVSLGDLVLRVGTAAVAVVSYVRLSSAG